MVRLTSCLVGAASLCMVASAQEKLPDSVQNVTNNGSAPHDAANPMLLLSSDEAFHYEILRTMSLALSEGADLGEVLVAAHQITASDFDSYYNAFSSLADRVDKQGKAIDKKKYPQSFRETRLKASSYYRAADFYLHGNWDDPRINELWKKQTEAFNDGLSVMPNTARRVTLKAKDDEFKIPAILFTTGKPGRHPTILMCNGYDGAQEEMYHVFGKAALDRGYNVITFEGPGQPTVRRDQGLGFIPEWEKVTSPVVDYALTLHEVDPNAIAIIGYSLGGLLASRAAAFEPRIAAVGAIDGVYDFGATVTSQLPPIAKQWLKNGDRKPFNDLFAQALSDPTTPTGIRWGMEQGRWSFKSDDFFDFATDVQKYTLADVAGKITQPIFIGDAELDQFFPGQAQALSDAATKSTNKVIYDFKAAYGAGEHCSVGAGIYQNQVLFDWMEDVFASKRH